MPACTFFGHRDCPNTIMPKLLDLLEDLIVNHSVWKFYVGNQGYFDYYVRKVLIELKRRYPIIKYYVVLAYLPYNRKMNDFADYTDTIYPDGIENVPRKFAISYRNKWMIEQADYVVTYITRVTGGAVQFAQLAEQKKKICINIAV